MTTLPMPARLLYAASSVGSEALMQSRSVWLLWFYAPPDDSGRRALLPLGLVSALLVASKLVEAFDDTLIGHWSDRTRTRLGRRIPFVLAATPFWALAGLLAFMPPEGPRAVTALWFFLTLEAFFLFATLSTGPYDALMPEIATTDAARLSLATLRFYAGVLGAVIGLIGSGLLKDAFGFAAMAGVMAALALLMRYLGLAGVWRQARASTPVGGITLRDSLRSTFGDRRFLHYLPSIVLFQSGMTLMIAALPYYVNAVLRTENEGSWIAALTAMTILAMVVALPLFARLGRQVGMARAYRIAMLAAALIFPLFSLLGFLPGIPPAAQALLMMALAGAPLAGVYLFPGPLLAVICDADTARSGLRREGMYFGAQQFAEKTAGAAAPLVLALLFLFGNTPGDPLGIRLVGPAGALLVFAGWAIFRGFEEFASEAQDRVLPSSATSAGH